MGKGNGNIRIAQDGYQPTKVVSSSGIQTNGYQPSGKPNAGYQPVSPVSSGGNSQQIAKPPSKR